MAETSQEEQAKICVKSIESVFQYFVADKNASDLHIRSNEFPVFRINGDLREYKEEGSFTVDIVKAMIQYCFKYKFEKKAGDLYQKFILEGYEEDFAIDIPKSEFRARVNIFKSLGSLGIVMRKIPNDIPEINSLGLAEQHLSMIKNFLSYKEGLILVTGQTGSGKSTTLAAMINEVNKTKKKHIISIEEPVEFRHKKNKSMITHREVGKNGDTSSFANGIKAAVREDPDLILIGEIRDTETAMAALQAAQTGHLVFATLHTNSAPETLIRLLDMFPSDKADAIRVSLAQSLRLIISQKLVETLDHSRVLAYEFLFSNPTIKSAISKDRESFVNTIREQMNTQYKQGMQTMNRSLFSRYKEGKISIEKGEEYSSDRDEFIKLIAD